MYFYSKQNERKIIHTDQCGHIRSIAPEQRACFQTFSDAHQCGYRFCRHCSPLARQYRTEARFLLEYCRQNPITTRFRDDCVDARTQNSLWRIVPTKSGLGFSLYHKNGYASKHDAQSAVPGYHHQNVCKQSILDYLIYIISHEHYRMYNPVEIFCPKQPAQKGSKRYRKEQKQAKRKAKTQAAFQVMEMIDRLSAQAK